MKHRVTLTIEPEAMLMAKKLAHMRGTSVSALVESFFRSSAIHKNAHPQTGFIEKWSGKFLLSEHSLKEVRGQYLTKRYKLK